MPIDRRITNGLAWAGAALVVAIPVADFATSQFGTQAPQQVAVVEPAVAVKPPAEDEAIVAVLPTPSSQRPAPVAVAETPAKPEPVAPAAPEARPDPVTTASAGNTASNGSVVDDFISSGRPLPSYITGSETAAPAPSASVGTPTVAKPQPTTPAVVTPAPAPVTEQVAAVPPSRVVGFPTPVAQRPSALAVRPQTVAQPPLVIESTPPVITADDLDDWESGPLSEFLARRQAGADPVPENYDSDGFFLDQGPNSGVTVRRFPNAYDQYFYPFE